MNAPERPRHKLLVGKRIATIEFANAQHWERGTETPGEWRTLLIVFTDGTTAQIDAHALFGECACLEVEVNGY